MTSVYVQASSGETPRNRANLVLKWFKGKRVEVEWGDGQLVARPDTVAFIYVLPTALENDKKAPLLHVNDEVLGILRKAWTHTLVYFWHPESSVYRNAHAEFWSGVIEEHSSESQQANTASQLRWEALGETARISDWLRLPNSQARWRVVMGWDVEAWLESVWQADLAARLPERVREVPAKVVELLTPPPLYRKLADTGHDPQLTCPVLLLYGELGTGKTTLAKAIHYRYTPNPSDANFQEVDISAQGINAGGMLFGLGAKGFPLARGGTDGAAAKANGGTLFLDEIQDAAEGIMGRILDLVQRGAYQREGEAGSRYTSCHIILATSATLEELIKKKAIPLGLAARIGPRRFRLRPVREWSGEERERVFVELLRGQAHRIYRAEFKETRTREWAEKTTRGWETADDAIESAEEVLGADARTWLRDDGGKNAYPWPGNIRQMVQVADLVIKRAKESGSKLTGQELEEMADGCVWWVGAATSSSGAQLTPEELDSVVAAARDNNVTPDWECKERDRFDTVAARVTKCLQVLGDLWYRWRLGWSTGDTYIATTALGARRRLDHKNWSTAKSQLGAFRHCLEQKTASQSSDDGENAGTPAARGTEGKSSNDDENIGKLAAAGKGTEWTLTKDGVPIVEHVLRAAPRVQREEIQKALLAAMEQPASPRGQSDPGGAPGSGGTAA
jgi:hypothetical protein